MPQGRAGLEAEYGDVASSDMSWQYKGWPESAVSVTIDAIEEQRWNIFEDDFLFPVMVVHEEALHHNTSTMSRFCEDNQISVAPHGKTHMSPELTRLQLEAGAWGITAATISQARIFRKFGVDRVLLANQVVDPSALRWVWRELQDVADFQFVCLVDSVACAEFMEAALVDLPTGRTIDVLVELGLESGRTGSRTVDEATAVARKIGRSERLNLVGVEGYEGILHYTGDDFTAVDAFLLRVRELTESLDSAGAFDHLPEVLVTAGGSMFPDRVAKILGGQWNLNRPVRTIIRAGGYITHDSILYAESGPFGVRPPMDRYPALIPALYLWAYVLSRPEPGLALAGFGKRDVSFDVDLPIPLFLRRGKTTSALEGQLEVFGLNDQHAYIRVPPDFDLAVGDIVGCGISHPCATFDRWRAMPLVDNDHNVRGAVRTFF
jgi:D-serine deaminase-like pyridoxal phosphate-dependent protein